MNPNDRQVAGNHYQRRPMQHWDLVYLLNLDYFQAQALKYLDRYDAKNGIEDLHKAVHFLEKYKTLNYPLPLYTEEQFKILKRWSNQYVCMDRSNAAESIMISNLDEAIFYIKQLIAAEPGATYVNPDDPSR